MRLSCWWRPWRLWWIPLAIGCQPPVLTFGSIAHIPPTIGTATIVVSDAPAIDPRDSPVCHRSNNPSRSESDNRPIVSLHRERLASKVTQRSPECEAAIGGSRLLRGGSIEIFPSGYEVSAPELCVRLSSTIPMASQVSPKANPQIVACSQGTAASIPTDKGTAVPRGNRPSRRT